jgi:hypothetical protein
MPLGGETRCAVRRRLGHLRAAQTHESEAKAGTRRSHNVSRCGPRLDDGPGGPCPSVLIDDCMRRKLVLLQDPTGVLVAATARVLVTGGSVGRPGRHERTMRGPERTGRGTKLRRRPRPRNAISVGELQGRTAPSRSRTKTHPAYPGSGWQCRRKARCRPHHPPFLVKFCQDRVSVSKERFRGLCGSAPLVASTLTQ